MTVASEPIHKMQNRIEEYMKEYEGTGAAVGIVDQDQVHFFSYGKKSLQDNIPISENTIFEIGSITKVFTTLVLMDMATGGELQLDEPLELYLPDIKIPEFQGNKITLRHLATHYSGLPCIPENFSPKNPLNPYEDYTLEKLYEFLNNHTLQRAPGEKFEYSNIGMGLLGHILSKKSGVDYEKLIRTRICEKLGLENTVVILDEEQQTNFAKGYYGSDEVGAWDIISLAGCGGLRSNIKDMTKFLQASMGAVNSPLNNSLQKCQEKQFSSEYVGDHIGLGWILVSSDHASIVYHSGGTGGFRSFLGFNLKAQKGVVILSNSISGWVDLFGLSLLDPDTYKKPIVNQELQQDLEYLKQFTGNYTSPSGQETVTMQVELVESELIANFSSGKNSLIPESFSIFAFKGVADQKLRFSFDNKNQVTKAEIIGLPLNEVALELLCTK